MYLASFVGDVGASSLTVLLSRVVETALLGHLQLSGRHFGLAASNDGFADPLLPLMIQHKIKTIAVAAADNDPFTLYVDARATLKL